MSKIEITNEREALAYLTYAAAAGDRKMRNLVAVEGAEHVASLVPNTPLWLPETNSVAEQLAAAEADGIYFLIEGDPGYPDGLSFNVMGAHAPLGLWVLGILPPRLSANGLSVVGTRAATSYGEWVTRQIVSDLPQRRVIVSGLAYGIDGAAHQAALACGKRTIAVTAGGVDRVYPAGHSNLGRRIIAAGGAIVSELPPGKTPTRDQFLARNRLVVGLTAGTLVVEAGSRSGSTNAAGWAERLHRPLMAVPGPITSAASTGTNDLIRKGMAELVTSSNDIEEVLA